MKPRVSVVVTAYNEGEFIVSYLERLLESVTLPAEILVVYDSRMTPRLRGWQSAQKPTHELCRH